MKKTIVLLTVFVLIGGVSLCYAEDKSADANAVAKARQAMSPEARKAYLKQRAAQANNQAAPDQPNAQVTADAWRRMSPQARQVYMQQRAAQMANKPVFAKVKAMTSEGKPVAFRNSSSGTFTSGKSITNSGSSSVSLATMQVQHMRKIMRGQVDYAVNVGAGRGSRR